MIIFFSSSTFLIFLILGIVLGFQTLRAISGIIAGIAIAIFVIEIICTVCAIIYRLYLIKNADEAAKDEHSARLLIIFVSSLINLFISYCTAIGVFSNVTQIDGFGDGILLAVEIMFCGGPWIFSVAYWGCVCLDDYESLTNLFYQLIPSAWLFFVYFMLPNMV